MKLTSVLLSSILFALSTNANANDPVVEAECAAIFKGMAIIMEKSSPSLAARARVVSDSLKIRSGSVIGSSTANRYYVMKMDSMTADMRANGGTGIRDNEMKYCVGIARSYGL